MHDSFLFRMLLFTCLSLTSLVETPFYVLKLLPKMKWHRFPTKNRKTFVIFAPQMCSPSVLTFKRCICVRNSWDCSALFCWATIKSFLRSSSLLLLLHVLAVSVLSVCLTASYPHLNNDPRGWNTSQDCWWLSLRGIRGATYKDVFSSLSEIRTWHSAQASAKAPWSGASFETFMETWAHTWHLVRFPSLRPKRTAKKASVFRTSVACWAVKKD